MCGVSFENIRGVTVCLFVSFFLQRELFLEFGALQPSNFINHSSSQNTVINDKKT